MIHNLLSNRITRCLKHLLNPPEEDHIVAAQLDNNKKKKKKKIKTKKKGGTRVCIDSSANFQRGLVTFGFL